MSIAAAVLEVSAPPVTVESLAKRVDALEGAVALLLEHHRAQALASLEFMGELAGVLNRPLAPPRRAGS